MVIKWNIILFEYKFSWFNEWKKNLYIKFKLIQNIKSSINENFELQNIVYQAILNGSIFKLKL